MTSSVSRVVRLFNSVALGSGAVLLAFCATARASSPDIPRLQADAERGSIKQQVELAAAYLAGRGVPQDEKRAAYWYEKAANAGDPVAQNQIGYFYQAGIGVNPDSAQAVKWFQRAAAGGLISAKVNLGIAYLFGTAVKKDPVLAQDFFRQAYAQHSGMAAFYLGQIYMNGLGVERDEAAGERWYEAGARLHDTPAEFQLANLLWHRQNSGEVKKAIKLLHEAAAGGMVAAKHQLGIVLVKRPDLAASPQEAPALLKESSEAGEWRSSVALGLMSRDGVNGVPVDPKAAYYHYRVAVLQGGEDALKVVGKDLDNISGRLGTQQTAAIDADAKAWFDGHHLALQFVKKDGEKGKDSALYAVPTAPLSVYAGGSIPIAPATAMGDLTSGYMEQSKGRQMAR